MWQDSKRDFIHRPIIYPSNHIGACGVAHFPWKIRLNRNSRINENREEERLCTGVLTRAQATANTCSTKTIMMKNMVFQVISEMLWPRWSPSTDTNMAGWLRPCPIQCEFFSPDVFIERIVTLCWLFGSTLHDIILYVLGIASTTSAASQTCMPRTSCNLLPCVYSHCFLLEAPVAPDFGPLH